MTISAPPRFRLLVMSSNMSLSARSKYMLVFKPKLMSLWYRNPSEKVTRIRHDESTSNLIRHADGCDPKGSSQAISKFVHGTTYNPGRFCLGITTWIARCHRPFAIVEDPEFIELLRSLNDKVTIPSARTVSCDVQEVFEVSQQCVAEMLKVRACCLHSLLMLINQIEYSREATSLYRWMDITKHVFICWYCSTLGT